MANQTAAVQAAPSRLEPDVVSVAQDTLIRLADTPAPDTIVASLILLVLGWVYLLTTSVKTAFGDVLNNTGILYATFSCVNAKAACLLPAPCAG